MDNKFVPIPGAAGFQLSNPSILDLTSICASLSVFEKVGGVLPLRQKSLALTSYLEVLLHGTDSFKTQHFTIITPSDPAQRGAQLSLKLIPGILDAVMEELEKMAVVVDERRPDVIRVAPAPLYNSFADCWDFASVFDIAIVNAIAAVAGEGDEDKVYTNHDKQ